MHISHPAAKIYCLLVLWCALCRHKYVAGFVAISAPWEGSVKALKGGHFLQSFPPSARHPQPSQETVACVPDVGCSLYQCAALSYRLEHIGWSEDCRC